MRKLIIGILAGVSLLPGVVKHPLHPVKGMKEKAQIRAEILNNQVISNPECKCENCICENCVCSANLEKKIDVEQKMVYNNMESCENGACGTNYTSRPRLFSRFRR